MAGWPVAVWPQIWNYLRSQFPMIDPMWFGEVDLAAGNKYYCCWRSIGRIRSSSTVCDNRSQWELQKPEPWKYSKPPSTSTSTQCTSSGTNTGSTTKQRSETRWLDLMKHTTFEQWGICKLLLFVTVAKRRSSKKLWKVKTTIVIVGQGRGGLCRLCHCLCLDLFYEILEKEKLILVRTAQERG